MKLTATQIFTGQSFIDDPTVIVTDNAGRITDLIPAADAGDDVQTFQGILCPGFINAHCHLELSHMYNMLPEKTGLVDFLIGVFQQRHFPEQTITTAIIDADTAMQAAGIVAVGDISNTPFTIQTKQASSIQYRNFIEVTGYVPGIAQQRFANIEQVYKAFTSALHHVSIVPHAPYSVSPELFAMINAHSRGKIISIHNQETAAEDEMYQHASGDFFRLYETLGVDISFTKPYHQSSVQTYLPWLDETAATLLVHNTCISEADLQFIQNLQQSIHYCCCINANLYIENTVPPLELLRKHQAQICLGTDSLASNHQLSIAAEIKTIREHFPQIPFAELLQWATYNGALALGFDDQLGSIEKGKQPGLLLIEDTDTMQVKRLI
jgi:cytosine/adenosine deaminase-related metal-dependent hydrolase